MKILQQCSCSCSTIEIQLCCIDTCSGTQFYLILFYFIFIAAQSMEMVTCFLLFFIFINLIFVVVASSREMQSRFKRSIPSIHSGYKMWARDIWIENRYIGNTLTFQTYWKDEEKMSQFKCFQTSNRVRVRKTWNSDKHLNEVKWTLNKGIIEYVKS